MFRTAVRRAHYETPIPVAMFDKPKMIKYRRRVLNYRRLHELPLVAKRINLGITIFLLGMRSSSFFMLGTAGWCCFGEDWGNEDVIFRSLRRWAKAKEDAFFQLTQEDIEELQHRGKID